MQVRPLLLTAPLALALACGGTSGSGSTALDAATPSYSALAMDQVSSDASPLVAGVDTSTSATMMGGDVCHPHLFLREREVVERINRHLYKALRHVEIALARNPLTASDATKTWESVQGGIDRKFTITLLSDNVYGWELDVGPAGTSPLPVAMTGQIDRTGATGPHQGKGQLHIDFAKLHAGFPGERVAQGTLDVQFTATDASRLLTVTATNIAWDLDPGWFDSLATMGALSTPRSGSYVYFREAGKGGSLKIQDQMVFLCPANPSLVPADAQLVSRWYRLSDGSVHGRSDALMQHGQLAAAGIDRVVGVTCHSAAAEGRLQGEGYWLLKGENASGGTLSSVSASAGDPSTPACDPVFGAVPVAADGSADFTGWPASYADGTPFPFPGM